MDSNFFLQILNMLLILPIVVILIYITLKFGGKYANGFSRGKIIRVLERVQLSQNTFIAVVLIDNKPYVVSNGDKGVTVLLELEKDMVDKYYNKNSMYNSILNMDNSLLNKIKGKMNNEKK